MALFKEGRDPREYFVELIRDRARQEGFQFTDFEREYLSRTAVGEDESASKMLDGIKGKLFKEFDSRISGLAWRAYQQDLLLYPDAKEKYEQAIRALANVETYLNLGMFVNCIALEMAPEKIDSRWPTVIILGGLALWLIYLVIRGMLKSH
jgi:hypothetical protein